MGGGCELIRKVIMAYTSQTLIQNYTGKTLTAGQVTLLTTLLPAVDSIINEVLGTSYSSGSRDFFFDGGYSAIDLPGLTTVTSVNYYDDTTDTTTEIDSDSYRLYPLNSTRKFYVKLKSGTFTEGDGNIKVVGDTDAAPEEVQMAATMIASDFLDSNAGEVSEEQIGDWRVKYSDSSNGSTSQVMALLAPYRDIMI